MLCGQRSHAGQPNFLSPFLGVLKILEPVKGSTYNSADRPTPYRIHIPKYVKSEDRKFFDYFKKSNFEKCLKRLKLNFLNASPRLV